MERVTERGCKTVISNGATRCMSIGDPQGGEHGSLRQMESGIHRRCEVASHDELRRMVKHPEAGSTYLY